MRCSNCKQWLYSGVHHKCPPCWDVWPEDEGRGDYSPTWWAPNPDDAATSFAEKYDTESRELVSQEMVVLVAPVGSDKVRRFRVYGAVEYSAEEVGEVSGE